MAIVFNPNSGLVSEDTAVIRARQALAWQKSFETDPDLPPLDVSAETPAGQLIDGETALIAQKDTEVLLLANMFNPKTAVGRWQDALAKIYFLDRQIARPTYVTCQVTGLYGTQIPYGAIVRSQDGYTFINTAPSIITNNGTGTIIVRCSETGAVEISAGAITQIITTVPGWDSVNNLTAGVVGRSEETQFEFEKRRADSVAKNSHGAVASVFGEVSNINNVLVCKILENPSPAWITKFGVQIPPHSIYISVYGGEDSDIAKAIYNKLDAGCGTAGNTAITYIPTAEDGDQDGTLFTYYIQRPITVATKITVTIRQTPLLPTDITAQIKAAVLANFNGENTEYNRVSMASVLYSSRFYSSVIDTGVEDLITIKITYPLATGTSSDSVDIPANELPVVDNGDINVVIV